MSDNKNGIDVRAWQAKLDKIMVENTLNEQGKKNDSEKNRLELISPIAIAELGKVLTFGARKYDAHNWRKGIAWGRIIGAILRHVNAFSGGEDKDPETGLSHLSHAMCEIMFLIEFEYTHRELDDRHKYEQKS